MIKQKTLEELIRENVFLGARERNGFEPIKCQICMDYKNRGGFKFDAGRVGYNCYNCGHKATFEEGSLKMSGAMRKVLTSLGISTASIDEVTNTSFFHIKQEPDVIKLPDPDEINIIAPPIKLPPNSYRLGYSELEEDRQVQIIQYLEGRYVDSFSYPFYFSTSERVNNHVIIPYYRGTEIIFWQARCVDPTQKKRWENSYVTRDAVIFNMNELYNNSSQPLLVCEGVFDALMFNGIAILGSKLTPAQKIILSKSKRRLVFAIQRDQNGLELAKIALELGYEFVIAPEGVDDFNDAVKRYGRIWVAAYIMKNIHTNTTAGLLALQLASI